MQRLSSAALLMVIAGCKAIPLNDDPTVPFREAHVSNVAIYEVAWNTPLVKTGLLEYQPSEPASPAVDPDTERVFVATRDGFVRCLSPADGSVEWEYKTNGRFLSGPTVSRGVLYVAAGDGVLYAFRALSGEKLWEFKAGEELVTSPSVTDTAVLIASQNETVFSIDRETGAWKWQYRRDAPSGFTVRGTSRPVISEALVYMGFADGYLAAIELETGVPIWEKRISVSGGTQFLDVDTTPVVADGKVFVASYKDGVSALDARDGSLLWSTAHGGLTALLSRGDVLFGTGDGSLSAFDMKSGRQLWSLDLSDRTSKGKGMNAGRALSMARGYVVVPTATALAFVEPSTGRVRAMWNPGRGVTGAPTPFSSARNGSRLYVISNLGTVYALQMVSNGG
ncbi:MAG: dehydrogenase [Archangium gephyra]|uniref:Dehydrogenase n=1 Tax=Archangium gephyra TaxID=48 RepID=A0A2W5T7A6_9BACT|nr:MAG: dehydrogenase [Archangium gephyra]